MKQLFPRICFIAVLALFACQFRAGAITVAEIAGRWIFTQAYTGESPIDVPFDFDTDGNVHDPNFFDDIMGTVTLSGTSVTIVLTGYPGYIVTYTGALDAPQGKMSGSVTSAADFPGGFNGSGTFTAVGTIQPPTTATLTFREADALYDIGTSQFSLGKFTATGSISLVNFPNTNPTALDLPPDAELTISFGGTPPIVIHGGVLSDAILNSHTTASRKAFHGEPFQGDSFFDGLAVLKVPIPKVYKTTSFAMTAGWIFSGPRGNPANKLSFSIIGYGRAWGAIGGGGGNAQGLFGVASESLGNETQIGQGPIYYPTITFGNAVKKVSATIELDGKLSVRTKEVTIKEKLATKKSSVSLTAKGPPKHPL